MPLALKIAIATYGHTAALKNGSVTVEGMQANFVEIKPIIAAFRRMVRDVEFDVCEMAPATYMIAREAGAPFKAVPVFIFRRFHHGGLVYRDDAGIRSPRDHKDDHYRRMSAIVGDPLPYGLKANLPSIEALIQYCFQQGLLKKRFSARDMFLDPEAP